MKTLHRFGPLIARNALAAIFLVTGLMKLADPDGTAAAIASMGLPLSGVLALAAGMLELLGGAALALGLRARWAALALIGFLVPATILFHNPLGLPGPEARLQLLNLLKNLAIGGGLLAIASFGAGPSSLDRRLGSQGA